MRARVASGMFDLMPGTRQPGPIHHDRRAMARLQSKSRLIDHRLTLIRPSGTDHRVKARVERPYFNRRYGHFGNRRRTPAPPHVPIPWRRRALGRAIHPMTTVPLGLAIDAAIEAAGGYRLEVTTLRYSSFSMEAPTSNRRTLTATAIVTLTGRRHIEVTCTVTEGERTILQGIFGLVRVVRGRASRLTDVVGAPDSLGGPHNPR